MQCKKCLVGGRVQGVFYRATAARRAEVLACGDEQALSTFLGWLWVGSSASKVTSVQVTDAPGDGPPAFTTL